MTLSDPEDFSAAEQVSTPPINERHWVSRDRPDTHGVGRPTSRWPDSVYRVICYRWHDGQLKEAPLCVRHSSRLSVPRFS
jgi:hypothetical protein